MFVLHQLRPRRALEPLQQLGTGHDHQPHAAQRVRHQPLGLRRHAHVEQHVQALLQQGCGGTAGRLARESFGRVGEPPGGNEFVEQRQQQTMGSNAQHAGTALACSEQRGLRGFAHQHGVAIHLFSDGGEAEPHVRSGAASAHRAAIPMPADGG